MLPFIAIWGIQAFNYTAFSLVLGALAVVVIYLVIDQLIRLGWIKLSRSGAIWLTALFAFGTVYWWLSIHVADGFLCQVVTVLACGLAFLSVLRKYSPWVAGVFLAMAILCRPNVFVLWPALLAITIQLNLNKEKVDWRYAIQMECDFGNSCDPWCGPACSTIIMSGSGISLISDMQPSMVQSFSWKKCRNMGYGIYHYAPFNLRSMFVFLPQLTAQCRYYLPRGYGMSILLTTPALIYVVRKFKITWWMGGCWVSIILSIALLAMYSNNGANPVWVQICNGLYHSGHHDHRL